MNVNDGPLGMLWLYTPKFNEGMAEIGWVNLNDPAKIKKSGLLNSWIAS